VSEKLIEFAQKMTDCDPSLLPILSKFQLHPEAIRRVIACEGGLSGSEAWKVEVIHASYCLKLMPPDFSVNRLLSVHHAANHRRRRGMTCLAGFSPGTDGQTYVAADGRLWELQTWVDGQPPRVPCLAPQKKAMFHAIAEFHACHETPARETAVSPGLLARIERCAYWKARHLRGDWPSLHGFGHPQWKLPLQQFLDSFVRYHTWLEPLLLSLRHEAFLLEDCIADPRPENFRFAGDRLSGLFDLGSLRWDNIALDVARLASEVSVDGQIDWDFAFQETGSIRPLTPSEERLAIALDAANVLLTGLNWVQWLVEERVRFASELQVNARLAHLVARLAQIEKHAAWQLG